MLCRNPYDPANRGRPSQGSEDRDHSGHRPIVRFVLHTSRRNVQHEKVQAGMSEPDPSTPHGRLQIARSKAGYQTASEAARAFGWNENTYRSHENGERGLKRPVAERYAKAFKVSPAYLLLGTQEERFVSRTPILGRINDGASVEFFHEKRMLPYDAQLPFLFGEQTFGFEVSDNTNLIVFQPGDLLLVWGLRQRVPRNSPLYAIIQMDDESGLLRLARKGSVDGTYHLEFPMMPTLVDVRPASLSLVHIVVPRGEWDRISLETGERLPDPYLS